MVSYDRVIDFLRTLTPDDEGELGEFYRACVDEGVPVIRPETRTLIANQLRLSKPVNILEVGSAVGYSSIFMATTLREISSSSCAGADAFNYKITTIELDADRALRARDNFKRFGFENVISLLEGDAADIMPTLTTDSYDFIFVDAAKAQYVNYLVEANRLLKVGGILFSDNIFGDGDIFESHFTVEKRNRTIHDKMREYVRTLVDDDTYETTLLANGDGVAISIKIR